MRPYLPRSAQECNGELKKAKVTSTEERQEIDIAYEIHTHTVVCEIKECPQCGFKNKGQFPKGMAGPIQYGIGIKAGIINFVMVQMLSLQRTGEHFKGLVGRLISRASMLKCTYPISVILLSFGRLRQ